MPWVDDSGAPVTDPLVLRQLGAPGAAAPAPAAAAPAGRWVDAAGAPVTDPLVLRQLGTPSAAAPAAPAVGRLSSGIPAIDAAQAFTDQVTRHLTFGLQDKMRALVPATNNAVASLFGGGDGRSFSDTYHAELARQRAAADQYATDHPFLSAAATGLGLMTSAAPAMTLGGGVGRNAIGQFTQAMPAISLGNAAVPVGVGNLVRQGAAMGGLAGLGASNDGSLGQTIQDVGAGALTGGATAGLLGTVGPRVAAAANDLLHSRAAHMVGLPGLLAAGYEAVQHPAVIPYALGGLGASYALTQVPPRAAHALVPLAARAAGSLAPDVVAESAN